MLVLIDNYDSFSHNLARYLRELGQVVQVIRNDAVTIEQLAQMSPQGLVISPGPCTPDEAGISLAAIHYFYQRIPVLGVCLGHQALAQTFGASVVRAGRVMHGKTSMIEHQQRGIFSGVESPLCVTRYHSLIVAPESVPDCFNVDAWCEDEQGQLEIMAMSHQQLPLFGLQFHPESVMTTHGHQLLDNFISTLA